MPKLNIKQKVTSKIIRDLHKHQLVQNDNYALRITELALDPKEIKEVCEIIYQDCKITIEEAENLDLEMLHNDIRIMLGKYYNPNPKSEDSKKSS